MLFPPFPQPRLHVLLQGFYTWLLMTLLIPFACSALLFAFAAIAWLLTPRVSAQRRGSSASSDAREAGADEGSTCASQLSRLVPAMWTLHIWLLLLLYPTLSRKTLATFDCVQLRGTSYLRDDPSQTCFSREWIPWAVLASAGTLVYAVGIPAGTWLLTQRHHRSARGARKVALLLTSYRAQFWWFEACDLLRKLLLTSVITLVAPNTKLQLWFGLGFSTAAALVYLKLDPYRDALSSRLQQAVLLQVGWPARSHLTPVLTAPDSTGLSSTSPHPASLASSLEPLPCLPDSNPSLPPDFNPSHASESRRAPRSSSRTWPHSTSSLTHGSSLRPTRPTSTPPT